MIEDKLLRLMNQELDGANTAADSRALSESLVGNAEARTLFNELRTAMALVRGIPGLEPGPDFKRKVLDDIRRNAGPAAAKREADMADRGFRPKRLAFASLKLKYVLFFALGLCLGMLLLFVFKYRSGDGGLDARQLVGTVADTKALRPVDNLKLDREGVASQELAFRSGGGRLEVDVRGTAAKSVEIVFTFDPAVLSLDAFRQSAGEPAGVDLGPGRLAVRTAGAHGFLAAFKAGAGLPASLQYQVFDSGAVVFDKTLTVPINGNR